MCRSCIYSEVRALTRLLEDVALRCDHIHQSIPGLCRSRLMLSNQMLWPKLDSNRVASLFNLDLFTIGEQVCSRAGREEVVQQAVGRHARDQDASLRWDWTDRERPELLVIFSSDSNVWGASTCGIARQRQFPSGSPGTFIRPSRPRLSTSCNGAMASAARDDQARRINSGAASRISPSGLPVWDQKRLCSRSLRFSNHSRLVALSWVPVYTTLFGM
jgi:hypothetical protein